MPKILKECQICEIALPLDHYHKTKLVWFRHNTSPICKDCVANILKKVGLTDPLNTLEFDKANLWETANRLCMFYNIPFVLNEWIKLYETNKERTMDIYVQVMIGREYEQIDWIEQQRKYMEMKEAGTLDSLIPGLDEAQFAQLQLVWGANYAPEEIAYLENLYAGIRRSHQITDSLQEDNARKVCKIALVIDQKIREGAQDKDFNGLLGSYDKLLKTANFTAQSASSYSDFESVGELFGYLEKAGWVNKYFNGVSKDIIDETIKNIQAYNRRLYTNESSISEEIQSRIESLKASKELERQDIYNPVREDKELEEYELDGRKELMEDFLADLDE